jgi:hypothetical protein
MNRFLIALLHIGEAALYEYTVYHNNYGLVNLFLTPCSSIILTWVIAKAHSIYLFLTIFIANGHYNSYMLVFNLPTIAMLTPKDTHQHFWISY